MCVKLGLHHLFYLKGILKLCSTTQYLVYGLHNLWYRTNTKKIFESEMVQFNGYFHSESVSTFKQRLKTFLLFLEIII